MDKYPEEKYPPDTYFEIFTKEAEKEIKRKLNKKKGPKMSSTNLQHIIENEQSKADLMELVARMKLLIEANEVFKQEKEQILEEVKKIGLKPLEFNRIVKFLVNDELLLNELGFLELINDNLVGD